MRISRRLGGLLSIAGALGVVAILGAPGRPLRLQFTLEPSTIPLEKIVSGGPGKDGIPALVAPAVVSADAARYLRPTDRVLAVAIGGEARAYPLRVLNWHELVNDAVGGTPLLITYCPLCGSGVAFDRRVGDATLEFGVSGVLFESNVLMFDRADDGLWSQLGMKAVTGPRAGTQLRALPLTLTTWARWRTEHPKTTVLSIDTGYRRDYASDPYLGYADVPRLMFPVTHEDARRAPKEWVVGVVLGGVAKAYPFRELARAEGPVHDDVGGRAVMIAYDASSHTATVRADDGAAVPVTYAFWFAWAAFYPETKLFLQSAVRRAAADAPHATGRDGLFPLTVGHWWVYEERSASGEVSAVERWQVRAERAGRVVLRTRQTRHDGRFDNEGTPRRELIEREEHFEIRSDGIVRSRDGPSGAASYLIHAPIESGGTWEDAGGRCRIVAVDASVRASGRWFEPCTQVACVQGGTLSVRSSYAPGIGLVRQDLWFGGLGPFDATGAHDGAAHGTDRSAAATLVLKAWGVRTPGAE